MSDKRSEILRWISEQEALCEAASDRPWTAEREAGLGYLIQPIGAAITDSYDQYRDDARFIAASRSVLPLALAALRATVEEHRGVPVVVRDDSFDGSPRTVYPCQSCDHDFDRVTGAGCPTIDRLFCSLGLDPLQENK